MSKIKMTDGDLEKITCMVADDLKELVTLASGKAREAGVENGAEPIMLMDRLVIIYVYCFLKTYIGAWKITSSMM